MSYDPQSLLTELDSVLSKVSPSRHMVMLRQVTELYLAHAEAWTPEQAAVFDAVIQRLAKDIGPRGQAELSRMLAAMDAAPIDTIGALSNSDNIAVSGPILEKSKALKDTDLVGIAKSKGQGHLLAIAGRSEIADAVTDVLVDRGDKAVKHKVIANEGAQFSEFGFARLISDASRDKTLAAIVAKRDDVPAELQPFLQVALS
ncbi:MAG TPA: DUF2336 domain-containing protein [Pseudolabrys sp.]|jgi:uncharacterized protein (DUF2336 family)|nr:DUF2336 domain-containing protein [Pseudolabrys sp.]